MGYQLKLILMTEEESFLVQFFGNDYLDYRKRTPVLIPFIR